MDVELKKLVNEEAPFGPLASEDIGDRETFNRLFSAENDLYNKALRYRNPVLGRRGSGKTSLLLGVAYGVGFDHVIQLKPNEMFRKVVNSISVLTDGLVFVEETQEFWNYLLWICIFSKLQQDEDTPPRRFIDGLDPKECRSHYELMDAAVLLAKSTLEARPTDSLSQFVRNAKSNEVTFIDARQWCIEYLESRQQKLIILMDSLEDFRLDYYNMTDALRGLLRCQAFFNNDEECTSLRFCLPSELFFEFETISSNPLKDFKNALILQWHPGELLSLACQRFRVYLGLYHPRIYDRYKDWNLASREIAQRFWKHFFPEQITNGLGTREPTLAYILRHTQLLPRHFIKILNEIAFQHRRFGGAGSFPFREQDVTVGVSNTERWILDEIIKGHATAIPGLEGLLAALIKNLELSFSESTLHKAYNRVPDDLPGIDSYPTCLRALVGSGLVGTSDKDDTAYYRSATFEYTLPHKLQVVDDDILCLHPLLSEIYRPRKRHEDTQKRLIIYPRGINLDTTDWRAP